MLDWDVPSQLGDVPKVPPLHPPGPAHTPSALGPAACQAPCLYPRGHLGLKKLSVPSGSTFPVHPGTPRVHLVRETQTKAHGAKSASGEKLHAGSPAEGGVNLCPARLSLPVTPCHSLVVIPSSAKRQLQHKTQPL